MRINIYDKNYIQYNNYPLALALNFFVNSNDFKFEE